MDTFDWDEFLETSKSLAIPEELFSHVESSINNGIKEGMLLEVCHKNNPDVYWIGKITMVCGHLLRIKYIGAEDTFWCDISSTKVNPLGWCGNYDELIEPPDDINQRFGEKIIDIMKKALENETSVSLEALKNKGFSPIDRIKEGMKVEVQNTTDPYKYWIASVCENVGGRLLLRFDGSDDDLPKFWIFYSNPRLCGFGNVTDKGSPWQFKYPGKVNKFSCRNKLSSQLRLCAEEAIKDPTPADLFQINHVMESHNFVVGMKLEALDPQNMKSVRPATVSKVFNNFHFLIVFDDHTEDYEDTKMAWLCDSMHPYIYPIGWAQRNSLPFTIPKIWKEGVFDWDDYLTMTSSVPAPEYCFGKKEGKADIKVNMKLEAVNPLNHEEVHVANVVAIVEHMLCVELLPIGEKFWYSQNSDLLFPVRWCDTYNYELHIPNLSAINEEPPIEDVKKPKINKIPPDEWCDRIYFNYKCYSGPMISRNKLSQLPKHVGPGPLTLVLKEVLNKIISASYKPAKLLRDWEVDELPEEGMQLEMLKAKLKTSTYHAYVPIATSPEQVALFCREYCVKLQACPCLFGLEEFPDQCPETCQQVDKSKFQNNGAERRGRPKGACGKKKKRKGFIAPERPKQPSPENENVKDRVESAENSSSSTPPSEPGTRPNTPENCNNNKTQQKRKTEQAIENSKMKTRGAKLPNFAVQMKEAHWDRKDLEAIYNNTCVTKKPSSHDSDTENESCRSSNSRSVKRSPISDVSDSEEPELKKLKFTPAHEPQPTDNKLFENNSTMTWIKGKLKLSPNPVEWSIDDVYAYLTNTEECRLVADKMKQEQIDGQAFILLDLSVLRDFLHIRKEYALKLCKHIAMIKYHYIVNYEDGAEV